MSRSLRVLPDKSCCALGLPQLVEGPKCPMILQQIAARVNSGAFPVPGLVSCTVESAAPPVLRYTFDDADSAHRFKLQRDALDTGMLYSIYPTRPAVVFEERKPDPQAAQWQKLMEEHDAARDAYSKAFSSVNRVFARTAQGGSQNPTIAQLESSEKAWQRWQDVQRRIKEFVSQYAR
jgi:hypothetical protein